MTDLFATLSNNYTNSTKMNCRILSHLFNLTKINFHSVTFQNVIVDSVQEITMNGTLNTSLKLYRTFMNLYELYKKRSRGVLTVQL